MSWGIGVVKKGLEEGTLHCLSEPSDGIMQQTKENFTCRGLEKGLWSLAEVNSELVRSELT